MQIPTTSMSWSETRVRHHAPSAARGGVAPFLGPGASSHGAEPSSIITPKHAEIRLNIAFSDLPTVKHLEADVKEWSRADDCPLCRLIVWRSGSKLCRIFVYISRSLGGLTQHSGLPRNVFAIPTLQFAGLMLFPTIPMMTSPAKMST